MRTSQMLRNAGGLGIPIKAGVGSGAVLGDCANSSDDEGQNCIAVCSIGAEAE